MTNLIAFSIVSVLIINSKGHPVDMEETFEEESQYDGPLVEGVVFDDKTVNEEKNKAEGTNLHHINNGLETSNVAISGNDEIGCEENKYKDTFGGLPAENGLSKREKRYEANVVHSCRAPAADQVEAYKVLRDMSNLAVGRVKRSRWYY